MIKTILILAANPKDTAPLRLDEEVREIDSGLRQAKQRDHFRLVQKWAVRHLDLHRALLECEPEIVHFTGHGSEGLGIQLENNEGHVAPVTPELLADIFSLFPKIECVLLNACYTEEQANAIARHIQFVIGMRREVSDKSAIRFAIGFYDGIGAGKTYEFAFKLGRIAIQMEITDINAEPILKFNKGKLSITKQRAAASKVSKPLTDDEIIQGLLSNNFYYIRKSYEFISNVGRIAYFQTKLLELFNQSTASFRQRIAIGTAFSIIGDPRNLDEMILIPSGEYWLGSDERYIQSMLDQRYRYFSMDETPQQKHILPSFQISKYPITNHQYADFLRSMPGHAAPDNWADGHYPEELSNHPVTFVNWSDAVAYARWRGGRLPTEFEWEKAARGKNKWEYPWGNEFDPGKCNVQLEIEGIDTTPVGVFLDAGSPYGVQDLVGNVWEWTSSTYRPYPGHNDKSIKFEERDFVTRGGSYSNPSVAARCSCRFSLDPGAKYKNLGFRIVIPIEHFEQQTKGKGWFNSLRSFFGKSGMQ